MKKLVIILAAIVLAISPIMAQDSQSFSDQMSALINNAKTAQDKMNADLAAAQAEQQKQNADVQIITQKLNDATSSLIEAQTALAKTQSIAEEWGQRMQDNDETYVFYWQGVDAIDAMLGDGTKSGSLDEAIAQVKVALDKSQKEINDLKANITWLQIQKWIFGIVGLALGAAIILVLVKLKIIH